MNSELPLAGLFATLAGKEQYCAGITTDWLLLPVLRLRLVVRVAHPSSSREQQSPSSVCTLHRQQRQMAGRCTPPAMLVQCPREARPRCSGSDVHRESRQRCSYSDVHREARPRCSYSDVHREGRPRCSSTMLIRRCPRPRCSYRDVHRPQGSSSTMLVCDRETRPLRSYHDVDWGDPSTLGAGGCRAA